jgi:hypothetical protein
MPSSQKFQVAFLKEYEHACPTNFHLYGMKPPDSYIILVVAKQ